MHHLTDDVKIQFIQLLKTLLKESGCILNGDVAFQTRSDLEKCHKKNKDGYKPVKATVHTHRLFEKVGFDGIFGRSIC